MKVAPRFPLEFPVSLNRKKIGSSLNLSMSGLGLTVSQPTDMPLGKIVQLTLDVSEPGAEKRKLLVKAKVVWSRAGVVGFEIIGMDEKSRRYYESLLVGYETLCRGFADIQIAA